jgi:hypothetical protein
VKVLETGQKSEYIDVADRSPTLKSKEMYSSGMKGMSENGDGEGRVKKKREVRVVV